MFHVLSGTSQPASIVCLQVVGSVVEWTLSHVRNEGEAGPSAIQQQAQAREARQLW